MLPVEDAAKTLHITDTVAGKHIQLIQYSRQQYWTLQSNPLMEHLIAYEEEGYCANLSCLWSALTAPLMLTSL